MVESTSRQQRPATVTQRDIAHRCGLSQMAVSLALREDPGVSAETAARVRALAAEMGYDPAAHQAARRLALQKHGRDVVNHVIGLLFPVNYRSDGYHGRVFQGITDGVAQTEFGLLMALLPGIDDPAKYRLPACFARGEIDGILALFPSEAQRPILNTLRELPGFGSRVIVSLIWPTDDGASIIPDYAQAAYLAARHLLEHGHRCLLHFVHDNPYRYLWGFPQEQRLAGVCRALREFGLSEDGHLVPYVFNSRWIDPEQIGRDLPDTADAFIGFLRAHPRITGILAWNDPSALIAIRALRNAGNRVPADYSVIGFDDTHPLIGPDGEKLLTTVRLPLEEIGRFGVREFIRLLAEHDTTATRHALPAQLLVRQTTAPPRTD